MEPGNGPMGGVGCRERQAFHIAGAVASLAS